MRRLLIPLLLIPSLALAEPDPDPVGNAERACGQAFDRYYAPKRGNPTADELRAYRKAGRPGVVAHCHGSALAFSAIHQNEYPAMLGETYLTPTQLQNVVANLTYDVCSKNAYQVLGDEVTYIERKDLVEMCGRQVTKVLDSKP